ncbi:prefoldin subunit alpha [Candidatus Micrarchaeota archaeon]|nr:prefoldin subunit alpha [Candidatus Micrarchaeota archaeon]MBD3417699.1 prefoldin subunit alpha [Candidatus Micrarchaeota archaeon]
MKQEEILANARMYSQQKQAVERELEKLMVSLMELNNSIATIKGLEEREGLVPIGGGAFVKAKLEGEKVLVPIGSGYTKEYSIKDASEEVSKRIELTEKAVKRMRDELSKVDKEMAKLEQEFRKIQQG